MTRNRILAAIAQGTITRKAAAEEAGVSARTINRWMREQGVSRPPSKRAREQDLRKLKERSKRILIVATKDEHPRVPAAVLGVSTRTVDRLRKKYEVDVPEFIPEMVDGKLE